MLEWWNWQTHRPQKPALRHEGSTPSLSTVSENDNWLRKIPAMLGEAIQKQNVVGYF